MDVPRAKLVWHKLLTPRYSFNLWLSFHKRLRTMDRVASFGIQVNPLCVLCRTDLETFDHLFFHCNYSYRVLVSVLRYCGWRGNSRSWVSITDFLIGHPRAHFLHSLIHLAFAAVVYGIWRERNARIFSKKSIPVRNIVEDILNLIECKLHSNLKFQRVKEKLGFRHLVL